MSHLFEAIQRGGSCTRTKKQGGNRREKRGGRLESQAI